MEPKRARAGICWFFASCMAIAAFILVLAAIALSAGSGWAFPGFALLVLAAAALGLMAWLIATAFRIERRS